MTQRMLKRLAIGVASIGLALVHNDAFADRRPDVPRTVSPRSMAGVPHTEPHSDRSVKISDSIVRPPGLVHRPDHPHHGRGAYIHDGEICLPRRPHSP